MPKMTIYIPDDVKDAMNEVEHRNPNWSKVAQNAFHSECERLNTPNIGDSKMNAVIERLRGSKQKSIDSEWQDGLKCGRDWAMNDAEWVELKRVADLVDEDHSDEWPKAVTLAINDDGPTTTDEVTECWERILGEGKFPSDTFAKAFVEGARDVFVEVNDKL